MARRAISVAPQVLFSADGMPSVTFSDSDAASWAGDTLVVFIGAPPADAEEGTAIVLGDAVKAIDMELSGAIQEFITEEAFEATVGTAKMFRVFGKGPKRIVLVGLGPSDKADADWRAIGASVAGQLKELKGTCTAGVVVPENVQVQALMEGIFLGLHTDKKFRGSKTPDKDKTVAGPAVLELLGPTPEDSTSAAEKARAVASGVAFARELVNAPANIVTPVTLASAAVDMASRLGLEAQILEEAECEAMGMGSYLSVSRCSNVPPKLIHLIYRPPGDSEPARKVGIVGKGLTFDSGGYNLKAGAGSMIEMMKFDMGGSASTLGAAAALAQLKPADVEVHFVVAACENMISGNPGSLHPGDVITAMDGTTIEVNNTDAEGRLTLADAILYCQKQGVQEVVDIATLTGACMVGLGQGITGMWSNCDTLAGQLSASATATGEKVWRMPLEESYWDGMKSDIADMKNTGPRFGGAITAALFLHKFVQKDIRWAHLDIAGPCWAEKPSGLNSVVGGTGVMVRTLADYVSQPSSSE